ncbi:MAG: hypothetical protein ACR2MK_01110, partial [Solirubrobacteraceae bacterium]
MAGSRQVPQERCAVGVNPTDRADISVDVKPDGTVCVTARATPEGRRRHRAAVQKNFAHTRWMRDHP